MSSDETVQSRPSPLGGGDSEGVKRRPRRRNRHRPSNSVNPNKENLGQEEGRAQEAFKRRRNSQQSTPKRPESPIKDSKEPSFSFRNNRISSENRSFSKNKGGERSSKRQGDKRGPENRQNQSRRRMGDKNNKNLRPAPRKIEIPPFERRRFDLQLTCVGCDKVITDFFSAIICPEDPSQVYHFDCALARVKAREDIKEDETVLYIGGGNFAIAKTKTEGRGKTSFEILRKIEFEPRKDENTSVEWRKTLQQR